MSVDLREAYGIWIALSFVVLACVLTIHQIRQHLNWNTKPRLRKYIIRILAMVPIYAFSSWLGLSFPSVAIYFDLARECYEAFVIYSFYQLLVQFLGGEDRLSYLLATKPLQKHQFPLCWLKPWPMVDYEGMTTEERDKVQQIVDEREREKQRHEQRREQAKSTGVNESAIDVASDVEIDDVTGQDTEEFVLQHPPNAAPVDSDASPPATSSRRSTLARYFDSGPRPSTPTQPTMYMAKGLAHSHVVNPFTPHVRRHSDAESGLVFGTPTSSPPLSPSASVGMVSTSPSHARLPYLYSPFLFHTQLGTLQYCILKPILALIAFVLSLTHVYGNGEFKADVGYPYIAFVTNASQIWAMYCLILFYLALKDDLSPIRPVPKFITVKAVVFFTWWQSVLFAALEYEGVIHSTDNYTALQWETALQDFVVCIEMLAAAFAHQYYFSYKDFFDASAPLIIAPVFRSIAEVINVRDVYVEDLQHMHKRHKSKEKRKKSRQQSQATGLSQREQLSEALLGDEDSSVQDSDNTRPIESTTVEEGVVRFAEVAKEAPAEYETKEILS